MDMLLSSSISALRYILSVGRLFFNRDGQKKFFVIVFILIFLFQGLFDLKGGF